MLDVYHAEPGANTLKVLLALKEKGVDFNSHYVALNKFEQHEEWFKKINPNGQVPVIVHDGKVINESTVINEYVDAVFEGPALRPADEYGKAMMRIWTKWVDEYFCPALSYLAWNWMIKSLVKDLTPEEFEAKLQKIPLKEQQDKWRITATEGYPEERLKEWRRQVETSVTKIDSALREHGKDWILGDQFTLADISVFAMAHPMPMGYQDIMNEEDTPHLMAWYNRMMERDGTNAALTMPNKMREEVKLDDRVDVLSKQGKE
ncbi:glutathione S-transferase family protein [Emcibacter nanhaiensis]|uniref:Glutathione S-transferase family protein n=1 Tax=Emcibacter nanhaiensis TaxID=1505037 RepID=A0A501PIL3_9PROT|nr:glutathione S-transferase family protein [Emcibacter nanhaiensis]TPD59862.1 glutathione S-transferase family protein [Emcibacter nanhaiensis]